jgi:hypothetical protein
MFKQKRFIDHVTGTPVVESNSCYFFTKDMYLCRFDFEKENFAWKQKMQSQTILYSHNDYLFAFLPKKKIYIISKENGNIKSLDSIFYVLDKMENKLAGLFIKEKKYFYGEFDLENNTSKQFFNIDSEIPKVILIDYIVTFNKITKSIVCRNKNGDLQWIINRINLLKYSPDLPETDYLNGKLNNINNSIIIPIKGDIIVSIDLITSKVNWVLDKIYGHGIMINVHDLFCLAGDFFTKIDSTNGLKTKNMDLSKENKSYGIFPNAGGCTLKEDKIYFTSNHPAQIGIFNTKTLQYEWVYKLSDDFESGFPAGQPPIVYNNYLIVLDINNTLHIFEKQ